MKDYEDELDNNITIISGNKGYLSNNKFAINIEKNYNGAIA